MTAAHQLNHNARLCIACLAILSLPACFGGDGYERLETVPVTGRVTVDGQVPTSPIKITCHAVNGMNAEHPTYSWSLTGEDGTFEISTFDQGDGVPTGEYALTFYWGEMNLVSMGYSGPDKLNDRYADPATSQVRFTVTAGESDPIDLETIALTTK